MSEQSHSNRLQANSVTTIGTLAISAAFMGPAVSVFFNTGLATGSSGTTFPLSFLISLVALLLTLCFSLLLRGADNTIAPPLKRGTP